MREDRWTGRVTRRGGTRIGGDATSDRGYADDRMREDREAERAPRSTRAHAYHDYGEDLRREHREEEMHRTRRPYDDEEVPHRGYDEDERYGGEREARREAPARGAARPAPKRHTAGRRPMGRGGNPDRTVHQLVPYALLCLAPFAIVSFILRDFLHLDGSTGVLGNFLADFLCGLFGVIAYVVPFFMLLLALRWRKYVTKGLLAGKLLLSVSFLLLLSGIIHVFMENSATRGMLDTSASVLYHGGIAFTGGGFFGGFVGEWLGYILRLPGTILLAIPLLLVIAIYLVGLTPYGLWERLACKVRVLREKREARNAAMYDGKEESPRRAAKREKSAEDSAEKPAAAPAVRTSDDGAAWCEPRPVAGWSDDTPEATFAFSDEEDELLRPRRAAESVFISPDTVDIPDDEPDEAVHAPAAFAAEAAVPSAEPDPLAVVRETAAAAAMPETEPPAAETPVAAPTAAPKKEQGTVYAPFALPVRPFPEKEASAPASAASASATSAPVSPATEPTPTTRVYGTAYNTSSYGGYYGATPTKPQPSEDTHSDEVLGHVPETLGTGTHMVKTPHTTIYHHTPAAMGVPVSPFGSLRTEEKATVPAVTEEEAPVTPTRDAVDEHAHLRGTPVAPFGATALFEDEPEEIAPMPAAPFAEIGKEPSAPTLDFADDEAEEITPEPTEDELLPFAPVAPAVPPVTKPESFASPVAETPHITPVSAEPAPIAAVHEPVEESVPAPAPFVAPAKPVAPAAPVEAVTERVEPAPTPKPTPQREVPPAAREVPRTQPIFKTERVAPVAPPAPEPVIREYRYPGVELLNEDTVRKNTDHSEEIQEKIAILRATLESFHIRVKEQVDCSRGPTITRYELRPEIGVSVRSVINRIDDISLNLAAPVRIEAPIPGKPAIGIEVPNSVRETVFMRTMLESEAFRNSKKPLEVPLGLGIGGDVQLCNLAAMPHLLVAGTTGSGKSVCINTILLGLIYKCSPEDLRLILIDPKQIEFAPYEHIPHLYMPIVTDMQRAAGALACAVQEMERRYSLIRDVGVRDIDSYNEAVKNDPEREHLPRIVIVIDEFADLKMSCANNDPETFTCRLAQKARAAGIHLIIGTQRPSVDVITGKLKNNIPSRIAFTVMQQVDSRTILDINGAESLTGKGDMLYMPIGAPKPFRVQGAYVSDGELERVVNFVRKNNDPVRYNQAFMEQIEAEMARANKADQKGDFDAEGDSECGEDSKFVEAVELAIETQKVATSLLQRRLGVGYGRAAKIIDRMEELGLVTPAEGNKPRKLLPAAQGYLDHLRAGGGESDPDDAYVDDGGEFDDEFA